MSDKIDLALLEAEPSTLLGQQSVVDVSEHALLALVRAVRAAMALMQPTPEQLRDPMFLHRAGEGLRSELEAFTDSGRGTSE